MTIRINFSTRLVAKWIGLLAKFQNVACTAVCLVCHAAAFDVTFQSAHSLFGVRIMFRLTIYVHIPTYINCEIPLLLAVLAINISTHHLKWPQVARPLTLSIRLKHELLPSIVLFASDSYTILVSCFSLICWTYPEHFTTKQFVLTLIFFLTPIQYLTSSTNVLFLS